MRKTAVGERFASPEEALQWLLNGWWVCWRGRPVHPDVALHWHLKMFVGGVRSGTIRACLTADGESPYPSLKIKET